MPSYRLHLPIGALRAGSSPADVLKQAALALGSLHAVERKDVEAPLVAGRRVGRVVLRFGVDPSSRAEEDEALLGVLAEWLGVIVGVVFFEFAFWRFGCFFCSCWRG